VSSVIGRAVALVAGLVLAGAGIVGLAPPASAAAVVAASQAGIFVCHATGTVVPTDSETSKAGWMQAGTFSGAGACNSGGTTWQLQFSGGWSRVGPIGLCWAANYFLDMHLTSPLSTFETGQSWQEAVPTPLPPQEPVASHQVIEVAAASVDTPQPFIGPSAAVPESFGVAETQPDACSGWPPAYTQATLPPPPPFEVTADWEFPGIPSPDALQPSVLSACMTLTGVLPRACVSV
jgi:hypothetical protein